MSADKEIDYIVCNPTYLQKSHIKNSVKGKCCKCDCDVWVAQTSLEIKAKAEKFVEYICISCAMKTLKEPVGIVLPLESQIKEINENRK